MKTRTGGRAVDGSIQGLTKHFFMNISKLTEIFGIDRMFSAFKNHFSGTTCQSSKVNQVNTNAQ